MGMISAQTVNLDMENLDIDNGTVEVTYDSPEPIGGFQFNFDGADIVTAYGGAAEENDFTVNSSATTVIGFSFSGSTLPAGSGIMTVVELEFTGENLCLTSPVVSDAAGTTLDIGLGDCLPLVESPEPVVLTLDNVTSSSFDIYMQNDQPISGFQFSIDGANITGAIFDEANLSGAIWIDGRKCALGSIGKCD